MKSFCDCGLENSTEQRGRPLQGIHRVNAAAIDVPARFIQTQISSFLKLIRKN
jgi:hypothetical protein